MLRVLVISALPAIRAGLRALVAAADDLVIVGEAAAAHPLKSSPPHDALDVLVLDADPGDQWLEAIPLDGNFGVVVLGPVADDLRLASELDGRGWGYLARSASTDQIVEAIRAVGRGLVVVDPSVGSHLITGGREAISTATEPGQEDLSSREREVLQLVALGLANKTIASRLGITEHTVKFHVASILGKLGAGSRTEAVHIGARRGIVTL